MGAGAVVARIITQYSDKGSKAAKRDIDKLGKNFDKFAKKSAKAFGVAALAGAAFAAKLGVDSVKAAIADEKSQALLANSLRNTTGANNEQIASIESYIDKAQRALGITDDELRPAFAKLASITGSMTQAQGLLGIAMDVSAGASVDMDAATNAVTKALQGNYKALKNLGVPITDAMTKSKDLNAVLQLTAKTFAGAAATRASTFEYRMKRVNIAFEEAKETLGNALLPSIEKLFLIITQKVIPAVQAWLEANGAKLVAAFQTAIKAVISFAFVLFKAFDFVARNKTVFTSLGVIFTAIFVAAKVMAFVTAITALVKAWQAVRAAATAAAAAEAAATGGISVAAAAAGVAAFFVTVGAALYGLKKLNDQMNAVEKTASGLDFSFDGLEASSADFLKGIKNLNVDLGKAGVNTKNLTKEQKLQLALLTALKKLGVSPTTETDPVQLEAARLNLLKQVNVAQDESFNKLMANQKVLQETAIAAQRYADILQALADSKITTEEVTILALKWGVTQNAARLYIESIIAINDQVLSAAEVAKLAETWGVTYKQASLYLDFFAALNDGRLSDAEIANLQTKWGFTSKAVTDYSAVFDAADDGKIDLTEINNLANKWGLTLEAAKAYAKKILEAFGYDASLLDGPADTNGAWVVAYGSLESYTKLIETDIVVSETLTGPGKIAAAGWKQASDAAQAYADKIAAQYLAGELKNQPPATLAEKAYADYLNSLAAKAEAAAAATDAKNAAKAVAVKAAAAKAAAGKAAAAQAIPIMADGGIVTSPTLAMIGEAGPEAVIPLSGKNAGMGGSITINVQGSVISEGDLVTTVRNAILQGQNSGYAITKSAVSL